MSFQSAIMFFELGLKGWSIRKVASGQLGWNYYKHPDFVMPDQGWKIHISASRSGFESVLNTVKDMIAHESEPLSLKFPGDITGMNYLNDGLGGVSQIGKIITIYTLSETQALRLTRWLDSKVEDSKAPYVYGELKFRQGSLVSLRYGDFKGLYREDEFGRPYRVIQGAKGQETSDEYRCVKSLPFMQLFDSPEAYEVMSELMPQMIPVYMKKKGKRNSMSALDRQTGLTMHIKIGRRGVGACERGYDDIDKLAYEYSLTKAVLQDIPIYFAQRTDFAVIAIPEIEGMPAIELSRPSLEAYLPQMLDRIDGLHQLGIIHRDIKLSNFMIADGSVRLIDYEAAAHLDSESCPAIGTRSYIPPEHWLSPAKASYDIYSFGVLLAHVVLGVDPATMPKKTSLLLRVLDQQNHYLAKIARTCLAFQPLHRPSAADLKQALEEKSAQALIKKQKCLEALYHIQSFKDSHPEGLRWRNDHLFSDFPMRGLNIGGAGVALGLLSASHALRLNEWDHEIIESARYLASTRLEKKSLGLFTGEAGIALVLAIVSYKYNIDHLGQEAHKRALMALAGNIEFDLFSGSAGAIYAACMIQLISPNQELIDSVHHAVRRLVLNIRNHDNVLGVASSGQLDGNRHCYLGAAHGASGIALSLSVYGQMTQNKEVQDLAQDILKRVWKYGRHDSGALRQYQSEQSPVSPNGAWCHGIAGYLWAILSAELEDHFQEEISEGIQLFRSSLSWANTSYCHGLSGQLELLKMLHKTGQHDVQSDIDDIEEKILCLKEDEKGWGSEDMSKISPDLWVGSLAPITALLSNHGHGIISPASLLALVNENQS